MRIVVTATPVTRSARSGSHWAAIGQRSSKPEVRSAMKAVVAHPLGDGEVEHAEGERGVGAGAQLQVQPAAVDALAAVGVSRGSATMSPPASAARTRWVRKGGIVSAGLAPSSSTACADRCR